MVITDEIQFERLEICETIEGPLTFTSFTYNNVSFPNLLYIEGFLKIHKIDKLLSVKQLLPNLVYIDRINLWKMPNENSQIALIITDNKDLEKLGFGEHIKISHRSVEIQRNPRLCLSDMIGWSIFQEYFTSETFIQVRNFDTFERSDDQNFKFLRTQDSNRFENMLRCMLGCM